MNLGMMGIFGWPQGRACGRFFRSYIPDVYVLLSESHLCFAEKKATFNLILLSKSSNFQLGAI